MSISIENKIALVTGANRGIGEAIVETFIAKGAKKVYLAVRNPESTKVLEEKFGDKVVTIHADVADTDSVNQLAAQAKDAEIVVNNAGIGSACNSINESVLDDIKNKLNVNTLGLLRVANAFADILENNKGAFVQLNSIGSIKTFGPLATYCASKAACYAITQGLRADFVERGIQVLSVHPGPIATDMAAGAGIADLQPASVVSEGIVDALASGNFHLFPDNMAKQIEAVYQGFSDNVIMADMNVS